MVHSDIDADPNQNPHGNQGYDDAGCFSITGSGDAGIGRFSCHETKNADEQMNDSTFPASDQRNAPCAENESVREYRTNKRGCAACVKAIVLRRVKDCRANKTEGNGLCSWMRIGNGIY